MELIKEYPILFKFIIVSIGLLLIFYISEYLIRLFRLKISRKQFAIIAFGLYLVIDFIFY